MSGARGGGVGWGLSGPVPSKRAAGRVRRDGAQPIGEMRARSAWSPQSPPHPARLGSPWPVNLLAGGLMAALIGAIVGIPSLRIKGLYLAIATLAGQLIIEWTINHVTFISGGVQASIEVARPRLGTMVLDTQRDM